jgi:hypothetical protein
MTFFGQKSTFWPKKSPKNEKIEKSFFAVFDEKSSFLTIFFCLLCCFGLGWGGLGWVGLGWVGVVCGGLGSMFRLLLGEKKNIQRAQRY